MQSINSKYLINNAFALPGRMCAIVLFPGCRCTLPRAMRSLPRRGAFLQGAVILFGGPPSSSRRGAFIQGAFILCVAHPSYARTIIQF